MRRELGFLALTGFFLLGVELFAPNPKAQAQMSIREVAQSTNTITQTINLSTAPTDMALATSSGVVGGYWAIEVYNVAASSNAINCGFDVSLSTLPGRAFYGREVPAGVGILYQVAANRRVYCSNQGSSGTVGVTVTQFK